MKTQLVAYCIEPSCKCEHKAGFIVSEQEAEYWSAQSSYQVRREIVGGVYNGMTEAEVIAARDSYNRLF